MTPPSGDLRARVLAEVKRTPAPTREEHERRVVVTALVGACATAALFFAMGGFVRGHRPSDFIAFTAGLALAVGLLLSRMTRPPARSMLGPRAGRLLAVAVFAGPALAAVVLGAAALWPEAAHEYVPAHANAACAALTLGQGALPLIVVVALRRGTDPVHPGLTGAALGMTVGAFATMMAYLRCPHTAMSHGLLAHVAPTIALMLVGAVLGRAVVRVR